MVGTLCKTVGHKHVEHVGIGEPHTLLTFLLTCFELIGHLRLTEVEEHGSGLCIAEVQVDEQIVRGVETYQTVDGDTRIVCGDTGHIADALTIDHQLYLGIFHAHVPVCRIDSVDHNFLCCTH